MGIPFDKAIRYFLLTDILTGFRLGMKYFFKPKPTINYPFEKGTRGGGAEDYRPRLLQRGDETHLRQSAMDLVAHIRGRSPLVAPSGRGFAHHRVQGGHLPVQCLDLHR